MLFTGCRHLLATNPRVEMASDHATELEGCRAQNPVRRRVSGERARLVLGPCFYGTVAGTVVRRVSVIRGVVIVVVFMHTMQELW